MLPKIVFRLMFCAGLILIAALAGKSAPVQRWVLHYVCDSQAPPTLCYGTSERTKEFSSRGEAVSFAESNYWFVPMRITRGKTELVCWWDYLSMERDSDDADSISSLAKEVDCDKEETLAQSYCDESGCGNHFTHHER
jgi:hypothetical protein